MKGIYSEGQLDESDLTFRDLNKLIDQFVRIITGQFHQRIAYPEAAKGREKGEPKAEGEAKAEARAAALDAENAVEDLKPEWVMAEGGKDAPAEKKA